MKKIQMNQNAEKRLTVDKAFLEFQRINRAKNLSERTISFYDDCYKYFRELF